MQFINVAERQQLPDKERLFSSGIGRGSREGRRGTSIVQKRGEVEGGVEKGRLHFQSTRNLVFEEKERRMAAKAQRPGSEESILSQTG